MIETPNIPKIGYILLANVEKLWNDRGMVIVTESAKHNP